MTARKKPPVRAKRIAKASRVKLAPTVTMPAAVPPRAPDRARVPRTRSSP